ncbi:hypothetical protein HYW21_09255 [Candidatus Woesearchaeota archaeon]|nr:hypothetical protein [Candidatus Woesearchaeota archaeon]
MIKQKAKNIICSTGIVTSLIAGTPYGTNAGSAEVMSTPQHTTVDLKTSSEILPHLDLFARNRTTVDYHNQVRYFGLADLSYDLPVGSLVGSALVLETQAAPGMGVVPRLGFEYFKKHGDLTAYVLGTGSLKGETNAEMLVNAGYRPFLRGDVHLVLNAEGISNVGRQHNFSLQRLRAGLGKDPFELGVALDMTETNKFDYNLGAFLRLNMQ